MLAIEELRKVTILDAGVSHRIRMHPVEILLSVWGESLFIAGMKGLMTLHPSSIGIGSMLNTNSNAFA